MCIVVCLIIINISQFRKVQIRINFASCYQPFLFDVAVFDGYQIINIKIDSPYMRRFSLFQSFTHFGFPGKLVNSMFLVTYNNSALPLHYCIHKIDAARWWEWKSVLMIFCLFIHVYVMLVVPRSKFMLGLVLSFQLNFPIATANYVLLNICNCGIISPHNCNCERNCIPLLANNCKYNCKWWVIARHNCKYNCNCSA